jgi:hypothetical protein
MRRFFGLAIAAIGLSAPLASADTITVEPPFPRPPVRPNGSFRGLPQKANS